MSSYKTHAIVEVDSQDRRAVDSIGNFEIELAIPIHFKKGRQYFVRAENIKVPTTFYQITSNFNIFNFDEFDGATTDNNTITVPEGNYTITELMVEVETRLNTNTTDANTYTLTYDIVLGKVNIAFTGGSTTVSILTTGTLNPALGFSQTTTQVITTNVNGDNVASVNFIRYLKLMSDLPVSNYYNPVALQRTLVRIPITEARYQFNFYENDQGYMTQLHTRGSINSMRFRLLDKDNNVVDLNGVDYSFELAFYEWRNDMTMSESMLKRFSRIFKN